MFSIFHPVPEQQFKVKLSRLIMLKWLASPQTQRPPKSQDALTHRGFAIIIFHPCLGVYVIIKYYQCSILLFFQDVLSKEKGFPHFTITPTHVALLILHQYPQCSWQTTFKWIPLRYQLKIKLSHTWAPRPVQCKAHWKGFPLKLLALSILPQSPPTPIPWLAADDQAGRAVLYF